MQAGANMHQIELIAKMTLFPLIRGKTHYLFLLAGLSMFLAPLMNLPGGTLISNLFLLFPFGVGWVACLIFFSFPMRIIRLAFMS